MGGRKRGQPNRYSAGLRRARDMERKLEREFGVWSEESEVIAEESFGVQCQACADETAWEKEEADGLTTEGGGSAGVF